MTRSRRTGEGPVHQATGRPHIPVLVSEVLGALFPEPPTPGTTQTIIDGTFGAGGYTRAILALPDVNVVAIDRDPTAIEAGQSVVEEFAPRLKLLPGVFGDLDEMAREAGYDAVDGVVLDIGVSSMQLDQAERGFSFQTDGPLDMRMSREGPSAADVVNTTEEEDLANILYELGEERKSRAVARAIVKRREEKPFERTGDLVSVVSRAVGGRKDDGRNPATRTFQALRIHVNDELGELTRGLEAAERILKPGGRLVVVTFHSLEDRIVKRFFAERSGKMEGTSRHLPQTNRSAPAESFRILNLRPLTPEKGELDVNPRARSARLRSGVRTQAPSWLRD
ncbi:MAG: 16S rRNA (cytosine(1402)-N(4))-methyltransferase RsmH [Hyphomicrobiaceae bacterium]|nr:16S rRNA (cytosine(1402)-N(4))-methyltransferase RsmH [Hyphomicrobiaceae bacterium]